MKGEGKSKHQSDDNNKLKYSSSFKLENEWQREKDK